MKTTFYSIMNGTSGKYCSKVAFTFLGFYPQNKKFETKFWYCDESGIGSYNPIRCPANWTLPNYSFSWMACALLSSQWNYRERTAKIGDSFSFQSGLDIVLKIAAKSDIEIAYVNGPSGFFSCHPHLSKEKLWLSRARFLLVKWFLWFNEYIGASTLSKICSRLVLFPSPLLVSRNEIYSLPYHTYP